MRAHLERPVCSRFLACAVLTMLLQAAAAQAQDGTPPSTAPRTHTTVHSSIGVAHIGFDHAGRGADSRDNLGFALLTGGSFPIAYPWAFHLGAGFGFTEFQRFDEFTDRGYALGKWSANAYADVWEWAGEGQEKYAMLRFMGAFFASVFLVVPLATAGLLYILSPLSPFSYAELDLMAAVHFADSTIDGFVEFGVGLLGMVHPVADVPLGGLGPALGTGFVVGALRLSTRVVWSPPGLHGEAYGDDSHAYVAHLAIGFER